MPARNRKGLSENTRKRIQTTMIVKRLEEHIVGNVEMTSSQVRAAEILLKKTLPDTSSVTVGGDEDNPLLNKVTIEIVDN